MFGKKNNQITLKIEGMTCDHCVHHVTQALESVASVDSAKVSLKKNEAVVSPADANLADMKAAVLEAGYKIAD